MTHSLRRPEACHELAFQGDWENPGAEEAIRDDWDHLHLLGNHLQHQRRWCYDFRVVNPRLARWQHWVLEEMRRTRCCNGHDPRIGFVVYGWFGTGTFSRIALEYPTTELDLAMRFTERWVQRKGMTLHGLGPLREVELWCPGALLPITSDGATLRDRRLEKAIRDGLSRGIFPTSTYLPRQIGCL